MNNIPQAERKYVLADIMKKRKADQKAGEERAKLIKERIQKKKEKVKDFAPAEKFVDEYRKQQAAYAHFKRKQKKQLEQPLLDTKSLPINKTLLVVRIRGVKDISDQQKKVLRDFGLTKVNLAVFVKATLPVWKKLKLAENYLTYGIPSRRLITELIVKKGFLKKAGELIPLKTNEIIEEHMSEQGIICTEDLVNELADCGKNFDFVTQFLAPLKLSHPDKQLKQGKIKKPLIRGGEWGYREDRINQLVEKMI